MPTISPQAIELAGWQAHPVGLEELALAYLREPGTAALPAPSRPRDTETTEVAT
ncbi:MAG TPA: hypothetical protein VG123_10510 [Streptosporangiaceae bacterium]|nr:hypothetical protein [Streptosporangiaceae bacterium]